MIIMKEFCKIRALARDGVNKSEIARRLHIDRKTVAKYLRENSPPSYAQRQSPTRKDPLLPFEKIIAYWHSSVGDLTGRDIYEKLVIEGYKGSERSVYRRLKRLRACEDKERFFQQSYEAGEQCQFDFKEKVIFPFRDGDMAVHLHFGTLPHSGFFFISAWRFKTYEAFAEGAHKFFVQAGGIPRNVRIDNLSPCVAKVLKGDNRIYTSHYNRFMEHYGFETLPCRPGVGSDKGDVEREIRTHTARIVRRCKLEGTVFSGIEDLNAWLKDYCSKTISQKIIERWSQEKSSLAPVPRENLEILCRTIECTPTPWGTVRDQLSNTIYSVPDNLIGVRCQLVIGAEKVKVLSKAHPTLLVEHQRQHKDMRSILLAHVIKSLSRKPAAMIRWAHKEILFPMPECKTFLNWLGGEAIASARREFLLCLNLIQHSGIEDICLGMEIVRKNKSLSPYEDLRNLLLVGKHPARLPEQVPVVLNFRAYDALIPKEKSDATSRVG